MCLFDLRMTKQFLGIFACFQGTALVFFEVYRSAPLGTSSGRIAADTVKNRALEQKEIRPTL